MNKCNNERRETKKVKARVRESEVKKEEEEALNSFSRRSFLFAKLKRRKVMKALLCWVRIYVWRGGFDWVGNFFFFFFYNLFWEIKKKNCILTTMARVYSDNIRLENRIQLELWLVAPNFFLPNVFFTSVWICHAKLVVMYSWKEKRIYVFQLRSEIFWFFLKCYEDLLHFLEYSKSNCI